MSTLICPCVLLCTQDSGGILWTYKCPKPVFSSPTLLSTGDYVAIGCVDGGIYVLANNGQHVSLLSTQNQLYAPTVFSYM